MNNLKPEDWAGTYAGKIPCNGCPAISTRIVFSNDGLYTRTSRSAAMPDNPYTVPGKSFWDQKQGLIIVQDSGSTLSVPYRMTKAGLIMMEVGTGERPRSERAEYTLQKVSAEDPTEHYWSLVELNGKPLKTNSGKEKPHLLLHNSTGKADGSGGCNRFNGSFEMRPNSTLFLSPLAATKMTCPGMNTETAFFRTIEGTTIYEVKKDRMTLRRDGKTVAVFEAVWLR